MTAGVGCSFVAFQCGLAQWCSGKEWSVSVASDVNSSLLSQLHRPRGSFWVVSGVPAISSPQSRLVTWPQGHVEQHESHKKPFRSLEAVAVALAW